jgi:hypothetical protein
MGKAFLLSINFYICFNEVPGFHNKLLYHMPVGCADGKAYAVGTGYCRLWQEML